MHAETAEQSTVPRRRHLSRWIALLTIIVLSATFAVWRTTAQDLPPRVRAYMEALVTKNYPKAYEFTSYRSLIGLRTPHARALSLDHFKAFYARRPVVSYRVLDGGSSPRIRLTYNDGTVERQNFTPDALGPAAVAIGFRTKERFDTLIVDEIATKLESYAKWDVGPFGEANGYLVYMLAGPHDVVFRSSSNALMRRVSFSAGISRPTLTLIQTIDVDSSP